MCISVYLAFDARVIRYSILPLRVYSRKPPPPLPPPCLMTTISLSYGGLLQGAHNSFQRPSSYPTVVLGSVAGASVNLRWLANVCFANEWGLGTAGERFGRGGKCAHEQLATWIEYRFVFATPLFPSVFLGCVPMPTLRKTSEDCACFGITSGADGVDLGRYMRRTGSQFASNHTCRIIALSRLCFGNGSDAHAARQVDTAQQDYSEILSRVGAVSAGSQFHTEQGCSIAAVLHPYPCRERRCCVDCGLAGSATALEYHCPHFGRTVSCSATDCGSWDDANSGYHAVATAGGLSVRSSSSMSAVAGMACASDDERSVAGSDDDTMSVSSFAVLLRDASRFDDPNELPPSLLRVPHHQTVPVTQESLQRLGLGHLHLTPQ